MPGIRHGYVRAGGVRIHVAERGEGPLVLLLHGFPELWYSWRHQIRALAEAGYRAVAIDQRGYGRSSKLWDPAEYRISRLVGDAVGVVEALGESRAVVVGHDWGAPVAWTAAWMHPETFRGVVGMSVPFGGRGLIGLPGSPFGEVRPSEVHRRLAGDGQEFYQDYFGALAGVLAEIEGDVRSWLRDLVYTACGDAPLPRALATADPAELDVVALLRESPMCIPLGARMRDRFATPETLPHWFGDGDLQVFTEEFERTGFAGGLSYYRSLDASWEELAPMAGKPVRVPALHLAGQVDVVTLWSGEAIAEQKKHVPELVDSVLVPGCGHWIQQERAEETNRQLLAFLRELG